MEPWCSLVNTLPCQGRDREFDSRRLRHLKKYPPQGGIFYVLRKTLQSKTPPKGGVFNIHFELISARTLQRFVVINPILHLNFAVFVMRIAHDHLLDAGIDNHSLAHRTAV